MRKYTQAVTVGTIVKHRIEEEIQKRNKSPSETSLDAVAGTDAGDAQAAAAKNKPNAKNLFILTSSKSFVVLVIYPYKCGAFRKIFEFLCTNICTG